MSVATMWFILGIVLLAVELVSPAFVLFFFRLWRMGGGGDGIVRG